MPVPQNWPLLTAPSTSPRPTTRTSDDVTGLVPSDTLNRTLDCVLGGKSKREIPLRVVTPSATSIGEGPSCTWYRPGLACSSWCVNDASAVDGELPIAPTVGRIGTSWYEGQPVPLRWVRLKPPISESV